MTLPTPFARPRKTALTLDVHGRPIDRTTHDDLHKHVSIFLFYEFI